MPFPRTSLAWGNKVSAVFRDRIFWIADELDIDPNYLMACMAWESAETFKSDVKNAAGSGATGLIQFMPSTARSLGTTVEKLAAMTPEDQLNYVYKYFKPYKGRLKTLGDLYMAILWPKGIGQAESWVLWDKSQGKLFSQNAGIDINSDGRITKAEATAKVHAKLVKGMGTKLRWVA